MLALIQLINRSGSMVLPFLAIYMTTQLGYSVTRVGWIMSVYGIGSLGGSYFGGRLTDRIGSFNVQFYSLLLLSSISTSETGPSDRLLQKVNLPAGGHH
jgi:predicted MFS family arabinose efflux permease